MLENAFTISSSDLRENNVIYKSMNNGESLYIQTEFNSTGSYQQKLNEEETNAELDIEKKIQSFPFGAWAKIIFSFYAEEAGEYLITIDDRRDKKTKIIINVDY